MSTTTKEKPSFSIPSIVALVATVLIFVTNGFDFALGLAGAIFGLLGALLALSPSVRGGIVSIASVVIGLGSLVVSLLQIAF